MSLALILSLSHAVFACVPSYITPVIICSGGTKFCRDNEALNLGVPTALGLNGSIEDAVHGVDKKKEEEN